MENKAIILRLYDEVFFQWNLAVLDEIISPTFIGHEMPTEFGQGPASFRKFYQWLRKPFADLKYQVRDIISENDKVVVRWIWNGIHKAEFKKIPPTNRSVSMTGIAIYRLETGMVVERWVEADRFGLRKQIT